MNETEAFNLIKKKLGDTAFANPAGSATTFPDFGFHVDGVDCHFEHKQTYTAQMSGLSSWYFKAGTFGSNVQTEEARLIVNLMRRQGELKQSAKFIEDCAKQVLNRKIGVGVSSTMLGTNKLKLISEFDKLIEGNKVLGKIFSPSAGNLIKNIYKAKFKKSLRPGVTKHMLFMMFGDEVWLLDKKGCTQSDVDNVLSKLGIKRINAFSLRNCYIEVRVSPRSSGLVDTKALVNLKGKDSLVYSGQKIT